MKERETIKVFLQGKGMSQIELVDLPADGQVGEILKAARPFGVQATEGEDLLVWLEGMDEPLGLELTIAEAGIRKHSRVHVHTCQHVEVTVLYNGQPQARQFSPAQTVEKVKQWADHAFHLSEMDAADHVLQVTGTTNQPAEDTHVGTLVHPPHCSISFDLVPKSRVQG